MTQMELADKLNVSFQAVSNWECGILMPDISKLPDITTLLDLSIDELLGKASGAINSIVSNNWDEYAKDYKSSMESTEELKLFRNKKVIL